MGIGTPGHRRFAQQTADGNHTFELGRIDVLAAGNDHVLAPILEPEEALRVALGDITADKPAIDEGRHIARLVIPVAAGDMRTAHQDLARHTVGHIVPASSTRRTSVCRPQRPMEPAWL